MCGIADRQIGVDIQKRHDKDVSGVKEKFTMRRIRMRISFCCFPQRKLSANAREKDCSGIYPI